MASKKKNKNKNKQSQTPKPAPEKELQQAEEEISPEEAYEAMMAEILPKVEEDPEGEIEFFDFSDIPDAPTAHHRSDTEDEELEFVPVQPAEEVSAAAVVSGAADVTAEIPQTEEAEPEIEEAEPEPEDDNTEEAVGEEREEDPVPVPAVPKVRHAPLKIAGNPMIRSAAAFAGILAAAGLIVSTVHVLTGDAVRRNEEISFNASFAELFPDASALREYTAEDGTTVWLAVKDGEISGYCVEENGGLIGYSVDGEPVSGVKIGTGDPVQLPAGSYTIDLEDAASELGLTVVAEETETEPSANEDNGQEEIDIGEAVEEGSETIETQPAPEETEPAETEAPETRPETETESAEPDVPVIEVPAETEAQIPDVPVVEETAPETEPETQPVETQPVETQPETWWTPETEPAETQPETWWIPETQPAETQPETAWTPETEPAETQPETAESGESAETQPETAESGETAAETEPVDTDMTGDETEPADTEPAETEPEISVEVEVEIGDPEESAEEETAPETEETKKKKETKRSGSGLF